MRTKKQIKNAFSELYQEKAKKNWESLVSRLQPQNFALTEKKKRYRNITYKVASMALVMLVISSAAIVALNRYGKNIIQTSSIGIKSTVVKVSQSKDDRSKSVAVSSATEQIRQSNALSSEAKGNNSIFDASPYVAGFYTFNEPDILDYNDRLYIMSRNDDGSIVQVTPQNKIGDFVWKPLEHDHVTNDFNVPAYTVSGEDITKSICILDTFDLEHGEKSLNCHMRYVYLCEDNFTIKDITYHLISNNDITGVTYVTNVDNNSNSNSCINTSSIYSSDNINSGSNANDYFLELEGLQGSLISKQQNVKDILNSEIGQISSGGIVYSIDEIDPSEAVFINIGDNWVLLTKANGYTGKTVDDVMKDKGIKNEQIN
jgi:hypothetical protein